MLRVFTTLVCLTTAVTFTACAGETPTDSTNSLTNPESPAELASPTPADTLSQPMESSKTTQKIALDVEGLRLVDAGSGSTRPLEFGTGIDQTVEVVTRQLGQPRDRSVNQECGAGPLTFVTWNNGLNLLFSDDKFAGWSINDRAATTEALTTIAGIGLGSTRSELTEAYDVSFEETTLGYEFVAGELYGILSSSAPDAQITSLWAGVSCNFR